MRNENEMLSLALRTDLSMGHKVGQGTSFTPVLISAFQELQKYCKAQLLSELLLNLLPLYPVARMLLVLLCRQFSCECCRKGSLEP